MNNKRVSFSAIDDNLGLGVGEPPGYGGGCTLSVSGPKTNPEVGEPPGSGQTSLLPDGSGRVSFLAIGNELGLEVGEPPGYGDGYTPSIFGHKADPKGGEPPGNGQASFFPDCGLCTTPSSGFGWKSGCGA